MEALRRDTFEDASSWAVDEFKLAVTSGLNLFGAEQKSQMANKRGLILVNMVNFGDDHFFLGGVCQSSSLHLFLGSPKPLPNPKRRSTKAPAFLSHIISPAIQPHPS